jgi:hypothetical protein
LGRRFPSTYVEDFDVQPDNVTITSRRMIGYLSQEMEMQLPCLLTVSHEYRPGETVASDAPRVRYASYGGKVLKPFKWTAEELGADTKRLGLSGSPTIVGAGVDLGKPPVQKTLGKTIVFLRNKAELDVEGKKLGPFVRGDLVPALPGDILAALSSEGTVGTFGYDLLAGELFA